MLLKNIRHFINGPVRAAFTLHQLPFISALKPSLSTVTKMSLLEG